MEIHNIMFKNANGVVDRNRFYVGLQYLYANKMFRRMVSSAKKVANEEFISEAYNPCKAAWRIGNCQWKS